MADGSVIIDTKLDSSGLKKGLAALGKASLAGLGAAVGAVGSLTAAAVSVGKEFEQSTAKASTLFGDVAVDVDNLDQKILDLSGKTGLAAADIGNSLYNALSAGIPATEDMSEAMDFMEKNARLASAGFTDVDTAVTATAKVLNAYGMDVAETEKVHNVLMQTQNKGITTVNELGSVLAQVTPTAAAMGFSFEQVGASLATMTAQGTPTAQATTQLNSLLAELGKSGTKANKSLIAATEGTKYAGQSFQEIMKSGVPLSEILGLISDQADEDGLAMLDMFSSIEAGKAALSLFNGEGAKYVENLEAMGSQAGVVGDAYDKMFDTFDAQKNIFIQTSKNLGIALYKGLQEPLKDVAKYGADSIKKLSDAFSKGGLKGLVNSLGSVGADIVNKVIGFAPEVLYAATDLVSSFAEGLIDAAPEIAESVVTLSEELLDSLGSLSVTLIELGSSLVVDLLNSLSENSDSIVSVVATITTGLISAISESLPEIAIAVVNLIPQLVSALVEALPILISGASEIVTGLIEALPEVLQAITEALPELIQAILGGLVENLPIFIDAVIQIVNSLIEVLPEILQILIAVLPSLVESISSALVPLFPILVDAGIKLFTSLIQNMPAIISIIASQLPQLITGIINSLTALMPQLIMCGVQLLTSLISNLPLIISTIVSVLPQIISSIFKGLMSGVGQMANAGLNLIKGIWQGMKDASGWIWEKVKGLLSGLTDKIKGFFGINSPSKLFQHEIGDMLMLGLAKGVDEETGAAVKATEEAARKVAGVKFSINPNVEETDYSAMVAELQGNVEQDNLQTSAFITGTSESIKAEADNEDSTSDVEDKDESPKYVQNDIYIDGKKTARIITPYVSKEINWEDK